MFTLNCTIIVKLLFFRRPGVVLLINPIPLNERASPRARTHYHPCANKRDKHAYINIIYAKLVIFARKKKHPRAHNRLIKRGNELSWRASKILTSASTKSAAARRGSCLRAGHIICKTGDSLGGSRSSIINKPFRGTRARRLSLSLLYLWFFGSSCSLLVRKIVGRCPWAKKDAADLSFEEGG